jgi:hypothetical protein
MKDEYENLRKLQNQRYMIEQDGRHFGEKHYWLVNYTRSVKGNYPNDLFDSVMTLPTKEACVDWLLEQIQCGEEIVWFQIVEAKKSIQKFVNVDHSNKEIRNDMRRMYDYDKDRAMINLTKEIDDYIDDDIIHNLWMEQGMRLGPNGEMIYEL